MIITLILEALNLTQECSHAACSFLAHVAYVVFFLMYELNYSEKYN